MTLVITLITAVCSWSFWLLNCTLFYVLKFDGVLLWLLPSYDTLCVLQVQRAETRLYRNYLIFWFIIGLVLCLEHFTYVLFYYVTIYRILRLFLIIWLQINVCRNTEHLNISAVLYIPDIWRFISITKKYIKIMIDALISYWNSMQIDGQQFTTEHEFAHNIIECKNLNGSLLNDQFIHIAVDHNNVIQTEAAINLASTRAFQSRLIPPITNIVKGKAFGEMLILSPTGLSHKLTFDGESAYRGYATFAKSDQVNDNISTDTFSVNVYYRALCFNPIRSSIGVDSSDVTFISDVDHTTYTATKCDAYNALYDTKATTLQHTYLNKMSEHNKMNNIYNSDTLPGPGIFKIRNTSPRESCRAYFTGLVVGGTYVHNHNSVAYEIDDYSEYVGQGEYPENKKAFPKSVKTTFDGIAIDRNTRVIIYEKENFQGKILLDAKGPKIINNVIWKADKRYSHCNTDIFPDETLQKNFPINVRIWSDSNMHNWSYGSVKILSKPLVQ